MVIIRRKSADCYAHPGQPPVSPARRIPLSWPSLCALEAWREAFFPGLLPPPVTHHSPSKRRCGAEIPTGSGLISSLRVHRASVSSVIIPPFRIGPCLPVSPAFLGASLRLSVPLRYLSRPFLVPHHSSLITASFFSITYTLNFAQPLSIQPITHSGGRGYPQFPSHLNPTTYELTHHASTHPIGPLPRPAGRPRLRCSRPTTASRCAAARPAGRRRTGPSPQPCPR